VPCKAKDLIDQAQELLLKAKAKDLILKAKEKDSKFVLEDTSRPRTKAKDNNTACMCLRNHFIYVRVNAKSFISYICMIINRSNVSKSIAI